MMSTPTTLTIVYFAWVRERIGKAREEVQTSAATPLELIADRIKAAGRQLVLRLAHGRRQFVPPPTSHFLQPPPAVIIHGRRQRPRGRDRGRRLRRQPSRGRRHFLQPVLLTRRPRLTRQRTRRRPRLQLAR